MLPETEDPPSPCNGPRVVEPERSVLGSGPAAKAAWLSRFPLRVEGGKVVDAHGERFKLVGVNWYGASDIEHTVGGLANRRLRDIAAVIAEMGFTVVRLPFSNQMMRPQTAVREGAIDFVLNPELEGKTPLEVLDAVVDSLGEFQVTVIPNNHCCFGTWGGEPDTNGLWFCEEPCGDPPISYSEASFFGDWELLAQRYSGKPWVVGYDLRNEVRPVPGRFGLKWPVWGRRLGLFNDWRAAAGEAGRRILRVNPEKLIVVERIVFPSLPLDIYLNEPPEGIPADRLVLGVHCYDWSGPGLYIPSWQTLDGWNEIGSKRKSVLDTVRSTVGLLLYNCREDRNYWQMSTDEQVRWYESQWGFALKKSLIPVWLSEFGVEVDASSEKRAWFEAMTKYLEELDVDYAYWPLNGGPKPSGDSEPYGLLGDDWHPHKEDWRLRLLERTLPAPPGERTLAGG
eukprot:TRINITY_DN27123_c0_g1_i2.p1 TRINITY_DN27123_c0_g1~~TRINITY_DN27123_c0_g1_i2.p1  ORF type:complete len:454 (-),score=61.46 TRINITY_DN27123_c0_g1_i2:103-1464(-)